MIHDTLGLGQCFFFEIFFLLLNFNVFGLKKERTGREVCLTSGD